MSGETHHHHHHHHHAAPSSVAFTGTGNVNATLYAMDSPAWNAEVSVTQGPVQMEPEGLCDLFDYVPLSLRKSPYWQGLNWVGHSAKVC